MSNINNIDDVVGFLTSVAEYALAKKERIPINDGAITVMSENYQTMQEAIQWIENEYERPKKVYLVYAENPNTIGNLRLKNVCATYELARAYEAEYDKTMFAYVETLELEG